MNSRKGLLLLNVGTPNSAQTSDVRKYLRQFLMDPYVLDMPFLNRWCLVHLAILPLRPRKSAAAYQKIWTSQGSPLGFHLKELSQKIRPLLGDSWFVQGAMRYGQPSIESAFQAFRDEKIRDLTIFPLYPQYSLAATESSLQECVRLAKKLIPDARMTRVDPFYNHNLFLGSFTEVARKSLADFNYDHLLFSFHGLPERQVKRTDKAGDHCFGSEQCCQKIGDANQNCYRAQCYSTAHRIAERLGLESTRYTVCFQSRLGRTPWIKPYTDELLREMPKKGIKRLAVICPAFVADCLETLEEIQIRGREEFIRFGGEDLKLVPSLNSSDIWVNAVREIALEAKHEERAGFGHFGPDH